MSAFVRDELNSGQLSLSQERILEMLSVLRAVSTLVEGLSRHATAAGCTDFYAQLVHLYPVLVDCVPSAKSDPQVGHSYLDAQCEFQ